MSALPKWKIAVLSGGDSEEREISLQSGQSVQDALNARGHSTLHLDPAIVDLADVDWRPFDVAFLALHGQFGEDGQVQQILEKAAIPYTGSDSATSRVAFSKSAAKERFVQFGVSTPSYSLVHYSDESSRIDRIANDIGFPLVVKPDCQGSSLGVTLVDSPNGLPLALKTCFQFDSFAVIERAIPGQEWTVGLLDGMVMPPILIETDRPFFDWQAKYEDEGTRYIFDSNAPAELTMRLESLAAAACQSLGTRGIARVDLRVDHANCPWVLEVNTIPGFTSHSLVPKAAARMGIEFGELCERAITSCMGRRPPEPHILHRSSAPRSIEIGSQQQSVSAQPADEFGR